MKLYYVEGPYSYPYKVEADTEQDALDKCCDYEQTMYDSWASSYDDYFAMECDFKIISEEELNTWGAYKDLVNYDFSKCIWGSTNFCDIINIE